MKTAIVAHYRAGVKFLEVELLVVELPPRFRVRLNEHLGGKSSRTKSEDEEQGCDGQNTASSCSPEFLQAVVSTKHVS